MHTLFWWGGLKLGVYLEDLRENGMVILKLMFKKCVGGMEGIDVAQDGDKWRAVVSAVMNFMVS